MPGIDFDALRGRITMSQVLSLVGFVPRARSGPQLRGPCPVHRSRSPTSRVFSVHLQRQLFHCFRCGAAGNPLQLWAAVQQLSDYQAALDLCHKLGVEVPWLRRW